MKHDKFDFELGFFEELHKRMPKDVRVASLLAHLYTETGKIDLGLRMDRKLAKLCPKDPTVHYNLACSLALKLRKADALKSLRIAIMFGYNDFVWMCHDPDLESLHKYHGFLKLCDELGVVC